MELQQSVSDLFLAKGDVSITLEHVAPAESALDPTVQDITAHFIGLGEGKLNLYVPSEAIIEPVSPAEDVPEESELEISTYEATEDEMTSYAVQSDHFSGLRMTNEIIAANSSVSDPSPNEASEGSSVTVSQSSSCEVSFGDLLSNPVAPRKTGASKWDTSIRKFIPPKKDRMDPLKLDMTKPTVIPLTSSQLSLQCLECHIIFSDDKSKQRHLKMNHPSEYEQCMLGDALFACYVCDRHFTSSTELMTHQRAHTEKQPFKCPICGEAFRRSSELTTHKKAHINNQGYTCSGCGKILKTLTLLKYHHRVHTGEKPYVCIHKECGKRFSMSQALQRHLEAHEKKDTEGVENLTYTPGKTKKKRSKGMSSRKYVCSQCSETFKTAKSQLNHIKTKHSTVLSSNNAVATGNPCVTTLTEVVQLPLPHMEAVGQTVQQIDPLGVEQIKRLIEKMGNVQKVNQLVILGLDHLPLQSQCTGMQQPQGLIQPLHFDFREPTDQQVVLQQAGDKERHEEPSSGTDQNTLLESVEVEVFVEQDKTLVHGETNITAECPEKQVTVVESDMTRAQDRDERLQDLTEKDILPPELEVNHQLILTTDELQIQDTIDINTSETGNSLCLTLITDCESKATNEKELAIKATDNTVSENTNTNEEPSQKHSEATDSLIETVMVNVVNTMTNTSADPPNQKASEALCSLLESEPQTGQGNLDELDKTNIKSDIRCKKATDSLIEPQPKGEQRNPDLDNIQEIEVQLEQQHLKEILSSEDQILQISTPFVDNVQHNQEISALEQAPCCESSVEQIRAENEDQNLMMEDSPYVMKALPKKKKGSKKPNSQYLEIKDEVAKNPLAITTKQKTRTESKTPKKQKKTEKVFEKKAKQSKKKHSRKKLLNVSKNRLYKDQQDIDPGNVPALSHIEIKKKHKKGKKKEKHKNGRKVEKSVGHSEALNLPCEKKVIKEPEQAHRGKTRKRKFENVQDLLKTGKSTQESQHDEIPVPKKKKSDKIPEAKEKKVKKVNKVNQKSHKLAKQKGKDKDLSETPVIDQIKQQALLLLKGHKQPQLKVHKLDAKTTELAHQLIQKCQTKDVDSSETILEPVKEGIQHESLQIPRQKKKKAKTKKQRKKSKVDSKQSSHLQTSPINNDVPSDAKQKVARKRKSHTKIDQEIALSPPYSRLIIGCHDCGKSFSEVSALQEHMALMHSENGAHQSVVHCDVSEMSPVNLRPNEIMLTNAVHSSSFEMFEPSDRDVETEMREIGLGDEQRNEHRLSFPTLSPSPSFPMTTTFVERESQQDAAVNQEPPLGPKAAGQNSANHIETNKSEVGEQENIYMHSVLPVSLSEPRESMGVKEALASDENLVRGEDQNKDSHISSKLYNISQSNTNTVTDQQEGEASYDTLCHNSSFIQTQLPTKSVNPASPYNAGSHITDQTEIKQEAIEMSVQTVASQTHTSMIRNKRGRRSNSRKRRLSHENRHKEAVVDNEEDCQVVFELYSLTGNHRENNEEILKNRKAINATAVSLHSGLKESSEVQEVCVLPQPDAASALEMTSENGSLTQKSGEQAKDSSFSGSLRKRRTSVQNKSGMRGQGQSEANDSTDVKIEVGSSVLTPHDVQTVVGEGDQEVQMVLVKAEDHQISNDSNILQEGQHLQSHHNAYLEKHLIHSTGGVSSGSPTVAQTTGKQCIFYPVKEEEGEMMVEPQASNQRTSGLEVLEGRMEPWGAARLEECEIRIGCPQLEIHHNLYSSTDESSVGPEQQSTEDIIEFLSQTSDMEVGDSVHSEPEAEAHIMSCYHGICANGAVQQCEMPSTEEHVKTSKSAECPVVDDQRAGSKQHCEPIDYFIQYFSWNIWKDIAACTGQVSNMPVTEKEVTQFVGIHIAMGTLKFPSIKLYWEEYTRVPLIADAMSAARFSELASNLRLASLGGDRSKQNGPNPHKEQDAHNSREIFISTKEPLWKVQAIVNKVQEGCQTLKRNGNYGVDQYLLPFQRHPTHSLHHTVMINAAGMVMDFNLCVSDSNREEIVEKMVSSEKSDNQGMVFLCKPELSTPAMLEHLLAAGVRSAGKVGGARGQIGDEFVTSDGKLKLFRCHHGFILSAVTKEKSRPTSLVSGFERAIKAANLNRDLRSLYRTPCISSSPSAWPQSVLWDLIDLALVNSWLQYKQDQSHRLVPLSLMAFRLEVSKALICSNNIAVQDSSPPFLPPPIQPGSNASSGHSQVIDTPLPDSATRYDGLGHWPEQLSEGEEARCRFGGCEQMSRVRCLKCCVFLCISRNHNCFLKFHSQGTI